MNKITIAVMAVLFITTNIFSQSTKKFIDTGSVKNQFEYLVDESNNYQDYKVVKAAWLLKLKSNVIDSLSASEKKISDNLNILSSQKKRIDSLQTKFEESEIVISNLMSEKESISLFGIQFEKSVFKTLFFFIVVFLISVLLFFITKFKQSNSITIKSKLALKQVEEEFETYRIKALEREQKAMRRLQDELNKNKKDS
ncbi:MAG: hypothetical protein PHW92_13015 [Lutibacter sp.]|nr:hypothetical protein [Lutibacter sp.]